MRPELLRAYLAHTVCVARETAVALRDATGNGDEAGMTQDVIAQLNSVERTLAEGE